MSTKHFTGIAMAIAVLTLAACSSTKLAETGDVSGKAVVAAPASPAPAPAPAKSAVAAVVAEVMLRKPHPSRNEKGPAAWCCRPGVLAYAPREAL